MSAATLGVPTVPGLDVSGVLYRYTTVKNPDDPMLVHVQNEDNDGTGYIFRETDDWSGLPGNTINKYIPVELTPLSRWGDGSIEVEGQGDVTNHSVVYTYRLDECFNAEVTPGCPGYVDPSLYDLKPYEYDIYDALEDDSVRNAMAATDPDLYEEDEKDESIKDDEDKATKDDFEKGLSAANNALTLANTVSQEMVIGAMNASTNMSSYFSASIRGGSYADRKGLVDAKLPENGQGLRNGLAQQILHEKMVEMQYTVKF